jgi:hypothetical protein
MRANAAAEPLLDGPGQRLYGRLVRAFPGHVILAQVAMTRLLAADPAAAQTDGPAGTQAGPVGVADFVVCKPDFTVLAVVDLDPGEAQRSPVPDARREPLRRWERLLAAAGIKVIRVSAADLPREAALKALVAAMPLTAAAAARLMRRAS